MFSLAVLIGRGLDLEFFLIHRLAPPPPFLPLLALFSFQGMCPDTVGVDYGEGPPVPIPNTEVKLARAEDTWLVTARENRFSPTQTMPPNRAALLRGQGPLPRRGLRSLRSLAEHKSQVFCRAR